MQFIISPKVANTKTHRVKIRRTDRILVQVYIYFILLLNRTESTQIKIKKKEEKTVT